MDAAAHLRHARAAGERIADAAEGADLKARVPSCPDYDLGSLLMHTGGFCRFARSSIEQGKAPDLDFSDIGSDTRAWHRQEHKRLIEVLEVSDPDEPGWSWGDDQRKAFWFRRAAQELGIHCWDVENAVREPSEVEAALAADGIDETLVEFGPPREFFQRPSPAQQFNGGGETIHLHATDLDDGGEFLVTCLPDHFDVSREHGKGDVAARGTASDLLLFLWGRVPLDRLEVHGAASLLDRWRERVQI